MPSPNVTTWPVAQDVKDYLATRGFVYPRDATGSSLYANELSSAADRAVRKVQKITKKTYSLVTDTVREYPGSGEDVLFIDWFTGISGVQTTFPDDDRPLIDVLPLSAVTVEWEDLPHGEQAFRAIRLPVGRSFGRHHIVQVAGDWGYSDGPPLDVARAAVLYAAADVANALPTGGLGRLIEWRGENRDGEVYEPGTSDHPIAWAQNAALLLQPYMESPIAKLRLPHGSRWPKISVPYSFPN